MYSPFRCRIFGEIFNNSSMPTVAGFAVNPYLDISRFSCQLSAKIYDGHVTREADRSVRRIILWKLAYRERERERESSRFFLKDERSNRGNRKMLSLIFVSIEIIQNCRVVRKSSRYCTSHVSCCSTINISRGKLLYVFADKVAPFIVAIRVNSIGQYP